MPKDIHVRHIHVSYCIAGNVGGVGGGEVGVRGIKINQPSMFTKCGVFVLSSQATEAAHCESSYCIQSRAIQAEWNSAARGQKLERLQSARD